MTVVKVDLPIRELLDAAEKDPGVFHVGFESKKREKSEKSMNNAIEDLSDYLEKADGAGGLPAGEPGYGTGVEVSPWHRGPIR